LCTKDYLLSLPTVQQELELSADQLSRLSRVRAETDAAQALVAQQRQRQMRELRRQGNLALESAIKAEGFRSIFLLTHDYEEPLVEVLDVHQRERAEQIQLQADGPIALLRPEVQERLNMAPEQATRIQDVFERGRQAIEQAATVPADVLPKAKGLTRERRSALLESETVRNEVEKTREAVLRARQSTMREIDKVFTENQRAKFLKMLGPPFDFTGKTDSKHRSGVSK